MDEHDKELKALEVSIQKRTAKMTSLKVGAYGSLGSLVHVIGCLGDTNKDVVRVLLQSKHDIMGSEALRGLLLDYFNCTHKTIEFLNTLHAWLHGASGVSWRLNRLKTSLQDFKADKTRTGYGRMLLQRALNGFMEANDPLVAEQLRAKLGSIMDAQTLLYDRLRDKQHEIDTKNMKRFRLYRKVSVAVLTSAYIGLLVCAAVTAALSPAGVITSVAVLAAIAAMNPTDYTKTCINHVLVKYEEKIKKRRELVSVLMKASSRMTLEDLEGIRIMVKDLGDKIQSLSANIAPVACLRKDSVVSTMIKDMEKKIDEFAGAVKDLESKKNKCYKDVTDARAKIIGTAFGR